MRLALVHSRYSDAVPSGENAVVDAECRALRAAGVEVGLFQTAPDAVRSGRLYPLRAAARVATGRGFGFTDAVEAFQPDLVHVHNAFPDLAERPLAGLPFPLVVTAHNYRTFCANGYAFRDGHTCLDCLSGRGGTWSAVRHRCHRGALGSLPLAVRNIGGPAANPLFAHARRVLIPSDQARRVLVGAGLPEAKAVVSPHFLPDALIPPVRQRSLHQEVFLFIGRLTPEKGLDSLLENWPAGRRLLVVGEGPERERLARTYGGRTAEFTGQLPRARVIELLSSARGLVFASRWWETFGLVAMEALAAGTPVVSVGQHAVADLVRTSDVGRAVASPEELPVAVAAIEEKDPGVWHDLAVAAFEAHFSQRVWTARRLQEYAEAAG